MAGAGLSQVAQQSQSQTIAPQMRNALHILQIPAHELRNAILEELQTNPVLEEVPLDEVSIEMETQGDPEDNYDDNSQELDFKEEYSILEQLDEDWRDYYAEQASQAEFTPKSDEKRQHFIDSIVSETSLQEHILDQAKMADCNEEQIKAIEYLIGSLDDRGFLTQELEEIAESAELPLEVIVRTRAKLMTFDPIGIASRDVQECLLCQLIVKGEDDGLAAEMIRVHYQLLLRKRVPELAKAMGVTPEEVVIAIEEIANLDPSPGRNFREDTNVSVSPDVIVEQNGDQLIYKLTNEYIPRLRVNRLYKDILAKKDLAKQEEVYIRDKIRNGRTLIGAIEQRQNTLERITKVLLERQEEFFKSGVAHLKPMVMAEMAEILELHETTISRALANKFIQTKHGTFAFKYFFTVGLGDEGEEVSNRSIKDKIFNIIELEDKAKPISDQKISELLAKDNIKVARRTVAKYREELGILATSLRKEYK